jgi:hypothetical protein
MAGFDASITGRKGFQSATRAGLPRFEIDSSDAAGRLKINPLASWTKDALDAYFTVHGLPRHPLVDQGYPRSAAPLHQQGRAGRRPAIGSLERLGQDRMRHSRARQQRQRQRRTSAGLRAGVLGRSILPAQRGVAAAGRRRGQRNRKPSLSYGSTRNLIAPAGLIRTDALFKAGLSRLPGKSYP